jgi:hypothetical protein
VCRAPAAAAQRESTLPGEGLASFDQTFFEAQKEQSTGKQWPLVHADLIRVDNVHRTGTDLGEHVKYASSPGLNLKDLGDYTARLDQKSIAARRAQLQQTIRECQMQRSIFVSKHIAPERRKSVQELLGKSSSVKEASWRQSGI